jgi:hypothetical protein
MISIIIGVGAGVFVRSDEGLNWHTFDTNLPNGQIQELLWSGDYLCAPPYGRVLERVCFLFVSESVCRFQCICVYFYSV